jgi:4-diphosphocytidyl-2-C-methyl-D-erythritol kinase
VNRAPACAKITLALVVGSLRPDGKHEVVTVYQRVDLVDRITVERGARLRVRGFAGDELVARALTRLAGAAGVQPRFHAQIRKRIPVAAGLGGGSSDAATALRLANRLLERPLPADELAELARGLGADVPFFLRPGPQLGRGEGAELEPLELPQDYFVLLALPRGARKESTADVYSRFDGRGGEEGFARRVESLERTLAGVRRARDLAALPPSDLAASPVAAELLRLGAFRADVSGAGPTVYGLFLHRTEAERARRALRGRAQTWITVPAWYF